MADEKLSRHNLATFLQIPMISMELWPQARKKKKGEKKRNRPSSTILPKRLNADLYYACSTPYPQ